MRKLIWTEMADHDLERVVRILNVINPKGHSAEHIKAHVDRMFRDENLDSYVGTAGWYVTVYRAPSQDRDGVEVWHALPTLMAYSLEKYLNL